MLSKRAVVGLIAMFIVPVAVGCQNTPVTKQAMTPKSQRAIMVTGGNGGGTTVYVPSPTGDVEVLSDAGAKPCAECKAAAMRYMNTGELETHCSECGGTRRAFTLPEPTGGHN